MNRKHIINNALCVYAFVENNPDDENALLALNDAIEQLESIGLTLEDVL